MNKKLLLALGLCVCTVLPPVYATSQITQPSHEVKKKNGVCSNEASTEHRLPYWGKVRVLYEKIYTEIHDTEQAIKLNAMLGSFFRQSLNRQPASPQGQPKRPRMIVIHKE